MTASQIALALLPVADLRTQAELLATLLSTYPHEQPIQTEPPSVDSTLAPE